MTTYYKAVRPDGRGHGPAARGGAAMTEPVAIPITHTAAI